MPGSQRSKDTKNPVEHNPKPKNTTSNASATTPAQTASAAAPAITSGSAGAPAVVSSTAARQKGGLFPVLDLFKEDFKLPSGDSKEEKFIREHYATFKKQWKDESTTLTSNFFLKRVSVALEPFISQLFANLSQSIECFDQFLSVKNDFLKQYCEWIFNKLIALMQIYSDKDNSFIINLSENPVDFSNDGWHENLLHLIRRYKVSFIPLLASAVLQEQEEIFAAYPQILHALRHAAEELDEALKFEKNDNEKLVLKALSIFFYSYGCKDSKTLKKSIEDFIKNYAQKQFVHDKNLFSSVQAVMLIFVKNIENYQSVKAGDSEQRKNIKDKLEELTANLKKAVDLNALSQLLEQASEYCKKQKDDSTVAKLLHGLFELMVPVIPYVTEVVAFFEAGSVYNRAIMEVRAGLAIAVGVFNKPDTKGKTSATAELPAGSGGAAAIAAGGATTSTVAASMQVKLKQS